MEKHFQGRGTYGSGNAEKTAPMFNNDGPRGFSVGKGNEAILWAHGHCEKTQEPTPLPGWLIRPTLRPAVCIK